MGLAASAVRASRKARPRPAGFEARGSQIKTIDWAADLLRRL